MENVIICYCENCGTDIVQFLLSCAFWCSYIPGTDIVSSGVNNVATLYCQYFSMFSLCYFSFSIGALLVLTLHRCSIPCTGQGHCSSLNYQVCLSLSKACRLTRALLCFCVAAYLSLPGYLIVFCLLVLGCLLCRTLPVLSSLYWPVSLPLPWITISPDVLTYQYIVHTPT